MVWTRFAAAALAGVGVANAAYSVASTGAFPPTSGDNTTPN
jgi:hypothetical protein